MEENKLGRNQSDSFIELLDFIADPIILLDLKGNVVAINRAIEKCIGIKKEEIVGKSLFSQGLFEDGTAAKIKQNLKDRFKGIQLSPYEVALTNKKGEAMLLEVNAKKIKEGNRVLDAVIFHDITHRSRQQKELEQALVNFELKFKTITDSTFDGIVVFNAKEKIQYWNAAAQRIFGYTPKKILGKRIEETIIPKSARPILVSLREEFAKNPENASCIKEIRLQKQDGTVFPSEVSLSPLRIDGEELMVATVRDITERKNGQELYHALFEKTPLGVIVVDPETFAIVEFNDVAHKQLGYTRNEFAKLSIPDFEANHDHRKTRQIIDTTLKNEQGEFVTKHRTKSGDLKTILVNQRRIGLSGKTLILATCHDVTGVNQLHAALRNSEERFNSIANSVKDAMILVDDNAKVTYWNPAAEKIFGYTAKEVIGKEVHGLVVPDSLCPEGRERIKESVKIFAETGMGYFTVGNVELNGCRKDGTEFPAELSISPMMLGGRWNAVGVIKDISNRRDADQKLREAEQRYHSLFNHAPLGICIVDPLNTSFVEFNDVTHAQLGYNREEFEKISVFDIEAKETPQKTKQHIKEMVQKGRAEFETLHKTKNGEIRNVIVSTRTFQSRGKHYLQCIFHDVTEIKKVQTALEESESRYRLLVELADEGIWAVNNDFMTVFVNPRMAQMLGYAESEMIGKSLLDFLDPAMKKEMRSKLAGFSQDDNRGRCEYAFPRKDGSSVETSIALSMITDDHEHKTGILAIISDITERKKAENALRESEERFRAISTSALDAIVLNDSDDRIVYWNPAAEKIFGCTAKEANGKKLSELVIPPNARKNHYQLLKELKEQPITKRNFGFTALKKDGTAFPVDLSVISVKLNNQNCLLTIIRDITEWKHMEEALRREKDLLEGVTKSTNIILSIIDRDYHITWVNQTTERILGRKDLQNKHCYEVFGNRTSVCPDCGIKRVFENGEELVRRDYCSKIHDKEFWVELTSTPIKDKKGKVVAALEVSMDINERKQLQNKLAQYSQRLEEIVQQRTELLKRTQAELVKSERLAAIGELAGMIGHDLRNPLTGIKNSVYFMKKKGDDLDLAQSREMLQIIDKCVTYSNRIINDLLDYSREIRLVIEEVSPKKLLAESMALMEIPESIQVINKLQDKPKLEVDTDKTKRVFINLIKNAVDAMQDGGKISVESCQTEEGLEISFSDTGEGISNEILPKLFSPLFTTKAKGMGFGLAICKRIVEAHGGTITVSTVEGEGTTFTLYLPFEPKIKNGGENVWINIPESSLSTTTKLSARQ